MTTKKICKVKKSKRQSTKDKIKISKKIRDSKRKIRKQLKKLKKAGLFPKKKSSNHLKVPNLAPFKRNLLEQLRRKKDGSKTADELENKATKLPHLSILNAVPNVDFENNMEVENEGQQNLPSSVGNHLPQRPKNNMKSIKYVFENADVVLEVLDARDPIGCRCPALERQFLSENPGKRLILVLSKIDLVPIEIAKAWKEVLSREFPTVLFKSNLQEQSEHLSSNKLFAKSLDERKELTEELLSSAKSLGAEKLLELIKNYSRNDGGKVSNITVGIIGFPNVGKSSLINSLSKRKAVGVSSSPGFTKTVQEVDVDSKVTIIDCPGVIVSTDDEITLLLRNTIKPEQVQDLERAVTEILKRVKKDQLLKLYKIADFTDGKDFVVKVAEKKGKIKKGGVLHLEETMRMVVQDWNAGKIKYYVAPPLLAKNVQNVFVNN